MARVGIDATSVSAAGKGIARVQLKSAEALLQSDQAHDLVAFVRSEEAERLLASMGVATVRSAHRLTIAWELLRLPRVAARQRLDVVVTTSDRLPLVGATSFVLWLFEIPTHRIEQNRRSGAGVYQQTTDLITRALWRRSVRRAACVVAGSHATADELRQLLPTVGQVQVVYPGMDPAFVPGEGPLDPPYVFHLGSSDPRDNTETAIDAFARALPKLPAGTRLVVGGALGTRTETFRSRVEHAALGDRVDFTGRVSDVDLIELYQGAAAYLDPSLFEGFGYQVLEAMACGAPVVASRVTSLQELVEGAGILCDPMSVEQFADALVLVLGDRARAAELRERGFRQVATFTWERTAAGLERAIEAALAA